MSGTSPNRGRKLNKDLVEQLATSAGMSSVNWSELARRTGISRPQIHRLIAGEHSPTSDTLDKLAEALDVEDGAALLENWDPS